MTLQQMRTLDAVIREGSVQAGARALNKTHPSVITALKKLEDELGFALFDRTGYRSTLTAQGTLFYRRARRMLSQLNDLKDLATHIRVGEATELNIVLGDVTPMADALKILRGHTETYIHSPVNLYFENIHGPNERLLSGAVDLIVHHIDKSDPRYEYKDFCSVPIVPVVAPGFLDIAIAPDLSYRDIAQYTQCIIRDTAKSPPDKSYYVLPDAPHITVGDQYTKKEIILQRMAWGHMPRFLIETELRDGRLLSLEGSQIKGNRIDIVVARRSAGEKSAMAERLWAAF